MSAKGLTRCGQPTKFGTPCRSILKFGQLVCVAHATAGTRPRGRCPECGNDHALKPDGTMHGHSGHGTAAGWVCGRDAAPMTDEQCERWDEADRVRQEARRALWHQKELERELEEDGRITQQRLAFRIFDDESFAACPWGSDHVALIAIAPDGPVTFACDKRRKQALLRSPFLILAAWPGQWSQHVFLLTEQNKASLTTTGALS